MKRFFSCASDQMFADGLGDGLGLGVDLQLLVDVFEVEGNGVDGDAHGSQVLG